MNCRLGQLGYDQHLRVLTNVTGRVLHRLIESLRGNATHPASKARRLSAGDVNGSSIVESNTAHVQHRESVKGMIPKGVPEFVHVPRSVSHIVFVVSHLVYIGAPLEQLVHFPVGWEPFFIEPAVTNRGAYDYGAGFQCPGSPDYRSSDRLQHQDGVRPHARAIVEGARHAEDENVSL